MLTPIQPQTQPAIHGTPAALLRAMTPEELRQLHRSLQAQYPRNYRADSALDQRYYRVAVSTMTRVKRELASRNEPLHSADSPKRKPRAQWEHFEIGESVVSLTWGKGAITRIQRDEGMGDWITIRVAADDKLRGCHVSELSHDPQAN